MFQSFRGNNSILQLEPLSLLCASFNTFLSPVTAECVAGFMHTHKHAHTIIRIVLFAALRETSIENPLVVKNTQTNYENRINNVLSYFVLIHKKLCSLNTYSSFMPWRREKPIKQHQCCTFTAVFLYTIQHFLCIHKNFNFLGRNVLTNGVKCFRFTLV